MANRSACKKHWTEISASKNGPGIPALGSIVYNCTCSSCKAVMRETAHWTSTRKEDQECPVKIGDRVLVHGALPGVVRYVGDLDSTFNNAPLFVGVKLDDPVGDSDGIHATKRFFTCPDKHGIIVPVENVSITATNVRASSARNVAVDSLKVTARPSTTPTMKALSEANVSPRLSEFSGKSRTRSASTLSRPRPQTRPQTPLPSPAVVNEPTRPNKSKVDFKVCVSEKSVTVMKVPLKASGLTTTSYTKSISALSTDTKGGAVLSQSGVTLPQNPSTPITTQLGDDSFADDNTATSMSEPTDRDESESKSLAAKEPVKISSPSNWSLVGHVKITPSVRVGAAAEKGGEIIPYKLAVEAKKAVSPLPPSRPTSTTPTSGMEAIQLIAESLQLAPAMVAVDGIAAKLAAPKEAVRGKSSYTSRLLSNLPDQISPLSPESFQEEVKLFEQALQVWGGDLRGWTMAKTLQRLKDGQRRGKKEVHWQKKIDMLITDQQYNTLAKHLANQYTAIEKVRKDRKKYEEKLSLMRKKPPLHDVTVCQDLEEEALLQRQRMELALEKIAGHRLAQPLRNAVERLMGESLF